IGHLSGLPVKNRSDLWGSFDAHFVTFELDSHIPSRAGSSDLTMVQQVERAGSAGNMTIKLKGDKVRIEASPKVTTILDGKTGEVTNLMNDQKTVVRI